jgi:hypothetical protein
VIGFLPCYLRKGKHGRGTLYLWAALGIVFPGIFLGLIGGEDYGYWYLDGLGVGFLLYCMAMPDRREEIRRVARKLGLL